MVRGFLLQSTYRIEAKAPIVHLYGVLEGGESFLIRDDRTRPRFWIRADDVEGAKAQGACPGKEDPPRRTMSGVPVVPIEMVRPPDVPPLRKRLVDAGIPTFEADVRFAYRYLLERGIRGAVEIHGDSVPGDGVDRVFVNPELKSADFTPELRTLSIDIETDPRAQRLLSIALVGCDTSEVLLLTPDQWTCPDDAIACRTERELLQRFVSRVCELDPDVLTGWNVVDFDLEVLGRVAERCSVPLTLGRGPEPMKLRPSNAPGARFEPNIPGRVVLDGIQLVRGAFLRFHSYSLDSVSREVLGEGKLISGSGRAEEILESFKHDRQHLVEYNRKDAQLVLDILDELQLLPLTAQRSLLTGMPPNRVAASIASFDFLYLMELSRRGIVAPTVEGADASMAQTGGHVLEPEPGLWRNVLVFDFQSLYPSVIRTFQIDPLGRFNAGDDPIVAPNGAEFSREPGILPRILDELFPRRAAAKKAGNKVASQAIKILMNSFYGVLGTPACRFASPDLANAITSFGREILLEAKRRIEAKGLRVLYGDTDSLFVRSGEDGEEASQELGERLAAELNEEVSAWIAEKWNVRSQLTLEFECLYLRFFLPVMRGGQGGARKRYAGLVDEGSGPEVRFTGMEVVRRDWTDLAKRVQRELYDRLFAERPVEEYLHGVVSQVRSGELDGLLVYRKGLRKRLDRYTASTPPHVAAARKMSGKPGSVIEYVITKDGPEPAAERKSELDREHYVQRQVRAVAEPVLDVLELDFDVVVGDDNQLALF